MNRKTASIAAIVAVALVLVGGLFVYLGANADQETDDAVKTTPANSADGSTSQEMDGMDMPADGGSSQSTPDNDNATAQQTNTVTISDFAYGPKQISVKVGTKVTWTNQDSAKHDVKSDAGTSGELDSGLLAKGESYSYTFTKAGTYDYHCSPHPYMKASVIVTE